MTSEYKSITIAGLLLGGLIGVILFFGYQGNPNSSASAATTYDLRNNVYLDQSTLTITATPEDSIVWRLKNVLYPSGASTTNAGTARFSGTAIFGASGSSVSGFNFGTCVITSASQTISASTTGTVECAAPGVTLGDNISVQAASTTGALFGVQVLGASASSTASGSITLRLYNQTGTTFTWTAAASSTWFQYRAYR